MKWLKDKRVKWLLLVWWDNHAICLSVRPAAPFDWSACLICISWPDPFCQSTLLQLILARFWIHFLAPVEISFPLLLRLTLWRVRLQMLLNGWNIYSAVRFRCYLFNKPHTELSKWHLYIILENDLGSCRVNSWKYWLLHRRHCLIGLRYYWISLEVEREYKATLTQMLLWTHQGKTPWLPVFLRKIAEMRMQNKAAVIPSVHSVWMALSFM